MIEEDEIARGREAKRILEHPLIVEAFESLEIRWMAEFRASKLSETDRREELYRLLSMLDVFKLQLTNFLETGTISSHALAMRMESEKAAASEREIDPRE